MKKLSFVTSNKGKLLEAEKLLSPLGFEVKQLAIFYPEIQASSLEEVVTFGIEWIVKEEGVEEALMIEDAGLFIHGLNDFPGVYSKYTFETIGLNGILWLMGGKEDRSAHFESCIGYWEEGKKPMIFKGRADGLIGNEPKGEHGFGYDPIFIPEGEKRTFAEMETQEKNQCSHRARALSKLADFLSKR